MTDIPQEGRPIGCLPLPRTTLILDSQYSPLSSKAVGYDTLLDVDSEDDVNAESCHDRRNKHQTHIFPKSVCVLDLFFISLWSECYQYYSIVS